MGQRNRIDNFERIIEDYNDEEDDNAEEKRQVTRGDAKLDDYEYDFGA